MNKHNQTSSAGRRTPRAVAQALAVVDGDERDKGGVGPGDLGGNAREWAETDAVGSSNKADREGRLKPAPTIADASILRLLEVSQERIERFHLMEFGTLVANFAEDVERAD